MNLHGVCLHGVDIMNIVGNDCLKLIGKLKCTLEDIYTGNKEVFYYDNLTVTAGKTMIAKRLAQTANDCNITYCAVGTDDTTPAIADITLGTEIDRVLVTTIQYSSNVISIVSFFGASDANGILKEIGFFGEAATGFGGTIGTMFNHSAISITKTSAKTLTIEWTITIS